MYPYQKGATHAPETSSPLKRFCIVRVCNAKYIRSENECRERSLLLLMWPFIPTDDWFIAEGWDE